MLACGRIPLFIVGNCLIIENVKELLKYKIKIKKILQKCVHLWRMCVIIHLRVGNDRENFQWQGRKMRC